MAEYPENCGSGEDMKVDGKVGIGTDSPASKLANASSNPTGGTLAANGLLWGVNENGYAAIIDNAYSGGAGLRVQSNGGIGLAVYDDNAGKWMIITNSGKVGMGIDSPISNFHLKGSLG